MSMSGSCLSFELSPMRLHGPQNHAFRAGTGWWLEGLSLYWLRQVLRAFDAGWTLDGKHYVESL